TAATQAAARTLPLVLAAAGRDVVSCCHDRIAFFSDEPPRGGDATDSRPSERSFPVSGIGNRRSKSARAPFRLPIPYSRHASCNPLPQSLDSIHIQGADR